MCATLTFGPLNHLCALTTHQIQTRTMGPPYTTHVQFITSALRSAPVTLGKHRMGTIRATKAEATAPVGME